MFNLVESVKGLLLSAASSQEGDTAGSAGNSPDASGANPEPPGSGSRWLLPLLLILVLIGIIWYFMYNHMPASKTPVMGDTVALAKDTVAAIAAAPQEIKVKLPGGKELDANKGGIEDRLVNFLNDPSSKPGKNTWFDFDNLNFKPGSADISNESIDQIENIAAILKAYPRVKIKIGGYTDRTGNLAENKKLSQDRAASVAAAIKGAGARAGQVTGAEGYGSAFAKAGADAPDSDRIKDRHISVSVRAK